MLNVRSGFVVVGCVFAGFVTSAGPALVASAAEPPRWVERAMGGSDDTDGGEAQRRIAQLEQRLKELEAQRATSSARASDDRSRELEAVIAQNRELTARNHALAGENQALAQEPFESPSRAEACKAPPNDHDPRAQIRYWARRMRDGDSSFRGRLTPEQNAAVQVLLRPERELDPSNPWRELGPQALASAHSARAH